MIQISQQKENIVTHIPAKGPKNTVYPDIKERNPGADAKISQGHRTQPPISAQITCPRLMLIKPGKRTVMSFAALKLLAEILVPSVAKTKLKEAKNAAARLSQRSIRRRGFQIVSP